MNPFDMLKNLNNLEKTASTMMAKLNDIEVIGESGAGLVRVKVNGKKEIVSLDISDDLYPSGDKAMLEMLIISAFNDAFSKLTGELKDQINISDLMRNE